MNLLVLSRFDLAIVSIEFEINKNSMLISKNADAKRQEIERLHKELKHLKDRYCFDNKQSEEQQSPSSIEIDGKDRNDSNKNSGSDLKNESGVGESPLKTIDQSVTDVQTSGLEWDKQSSSSMSELSVANLQDRINQMEETHYSTSEELQATLQELNDLQEQVSELQISNEQLELDKSFLLETLCSQTKKLETYSVNCDKMQKLIIQQYEDCEGENNVDSEQTFLKPSEREEQLVEMLKMIHSEKTELEKKNEELNSRLEALNLQIKGRKNPISNLYDLGLFYENQRSQNPDECGKDSNHIQNDLLVDTLIDSNHHRNETEPNHSFVDNPNDEKVPDKTITKLHNAKSLQEISMPTTSSFHSLDGLTTKETSTSSEETIDMLRFLVKQLQDKISSCELEIQKQKDRFLWLETEKKDEIAKLEMQLKNLENRNTELNERNEDLYQRLKTTEEAKIESEIRAQKNLEEKREIRNLLEEKDRKLIDLDLELSSKCKKLSELEDKRSMEHSEWKQFQQDLLTTVRVANDFKQEVQIEFKKLQNEKCMLEERLLFLEKELKKYKVDSKKNHYRSPLNSTTNGFVNNNSNVNTNNADDCNNNVNDAIDGPSPISNNIVSLSNQSNTTVSVATVKPITKSNQLISQTSSSLSFPRTSSLLTLIQNYEPNHSSNSANEIRSISSRSANAQSNGKFSDAKSFIMNDLLNNKIDTFRSRTSESNDKKDPLIALVRGGGSKRNALLKWCKHKTLSYRDIDITNFSSSWNDGMAFCAILHTYLPDLIPYETLKSDEKQRNFSIAFKAAESVGIPTTLDLNEMLAQERPDWHKIMAYITSIYSHFET
ncbi:cytospin-A-like protein [Sarcoptes scabiei]|uniref:Cytospin-A-like protein n=1 Tax=Sarcoptes scabiei TaxID=52283 RepID=A0A131ZUT1_SARSC|nr:cytospin-A-like protein [Sarcoptes scabiei]